MAQIMHYTIASLTTKHCCFLVCSLGRRHREHCVKHSKLFQLRKLGDSAARFAFQGWAMHGLPDRAH